MTMSMLDFIEGRVGIDTGVITRGSSDMILMDDLIDDCRRCLQLVTMTCETPRSTGSLTRVTTTIRNGLQIEASVTQYCTDSIAFMLQFCYLKQHSHHGMAWFGVTQQFTTGYH